jgi:hypothetical protein
MILSNPHLTVVVTVPEAASGELEASDTLPEAAADGCAGIPEVAAGFSVRLAWPLLPLRLLFSPRGRTVADEAVETASERA